MFQNVLERDLARPGGGVASKLKSELASQSINLCQTHVIFFYDILLYSRHQFGANIGKSKNGKKKAIDNYVHDNDVGDLEPDANEEKLKDS